MGKHLSILIIEDENIFAFDILEALETHGFNVMGAAATAEEALQIAADVPPDLLIVDYRLRGSMNGEETASAIRSNFSKAIPVIFVSGSSEKEMVLRFSMDPCAFLTKPIRMKDLLDCVESFIAQNV